jgi:hypothetical protein
MIETIISSSQVKKQAEFKLIHQQTTKLNTHQRTIKHNLFPQAQIFCNQPNQNNHTKNSPFFIFLLALIYKYFPINYIDNFFYLIKASCGQFLLFVARKKKEKVAKELKAVYKFRKRCMGGWMGDVLDGIVG